MHNYFNYFTEIEERFQQRRGSLLLLSTLDWALIESWRAAGVPLAAVLRGIDATFDKRDGQKAGARHRRVNGLAWCAQGVMEEAESLKEALVGAAPALEAKAADATESGFEQARVARHLHMCAAQLQTCNLPPPASALAGETAARLEELAAAIQTTAPSLEELERTLTVLEEKLLSMVMATEPEETLVGLREQAARELAPYRRKLQALQLRQIEQQFLHKRLLESHALPRLSLFYMDQQ